MIGQTAIKTFLNDCLTNKCLARFMIIRGQPGSGKKTVVKYLSHISGYPMVYFSTSVEDVRSLIDVCYQQTKPIIYCIPEAEKLSANAQNALLKVCEEPPGNAYIILTVSSDSLLPTLYSRAQLLIMAPYSHEEKKQFVTEVLNTTEVCDDKVAIAETPGDLIDLMNCDFSRLDKYCENVVELINTANIASVLKIGKQVQTKNDDDITLFNLNLFMSVLAYKYRVRCEQSSGNPVQFSKYYRCWEFIYSAKRQLSYTYNKQYILDELLLNLRNVV